MINFVHLHNHSIYSFLDGMCKVSDLVKKAQEFGMPAVGLTDHANLFGAIEFYKAAKAAEVKPILGAEFNFVSECTKERGGDHILLLAENNKGWQNLIKLVSISNDPDHFHYRPRIDFSLLEKHSEGLILLTGCIPGSPIASALFDHFEDGAQVSYSAPFRAETVLRQFLNIFSEKNIFLEVQDHGYSYEHQANDGLRKLAKKHGLRTVATNNVHYMNQVDAPAHLTLKAIEGFLRSSMSSFNEDEFYFKSTEGMEATTLRPEELAITVEIADRCNVEIDIKKRRLPSYPFLSENQTSESYLHELVEEGFREKGFDGKQEYRDRVQSELTVIGEMGFNDYFLIVWDVIDWIRRNEIPLGPGRGSVGGSLVAYLLGITDVDPMRYGLFFERFLNRGRGGLPDIDTDVARSRRGEVLAYIKERFGQDNVAQIATFGKLAARAVLKSVLKVFDMPFEEANAITSLIPFKNEDHVAITLEEALEMVPELQEYEEKHKAWFAIAKKLEGCLKSLGTHASAVVITDLPFSDGHYPLCRSADKKSMICAWDMATIDALSLLKQDVLGLTTLDIISDTLNLIGRSYSSVLDLLDEADGATFELLQKGRTAGIFQLESQLGRTWAKATVPTSLEEISDLTSLLRPGPLDSGMSIQYKDVKVKGKNPEYIHPALADLLSYTYGSCVYQEQIISICIQLAGMSGVNADMVRKAMGKKKPEEMAKWQGEFVSGCESNQQDNITQEQAEEIWAFIEKFAGYGFCRSHALAYSMISVYTACLKSHNPTPFFCACLRQATNAPNPNEEVAKFVNDAKLFDIRVVPPRLSHGNIDFDVVGDNEIAYGLASLKKVGPKAMENLLACLKTVTFSKDNARHDFGAFILAAKTYKVNRAVIESCIKSGSLDDLEISRVQMLSIFKLVSSLTVKELEIVRHFFAETPNACVIHHVASLPLERYHPEFKERGFRPPSKPRVVKITELFNEYKSGELFDSIYTNLGWERELLGIALSGSEADDYPSNNKCREVVNGETNGGTRVGLTVYVEAVKVHKTRKKQQKMAFVTGSDGTAVLDKIVVFPNIYADSGSLIQVGHVLKLRGKLDENGSVLVEHLERVS